MDNFNDLAALYVLNMIIAHNKAADNQRNEFSVKYDPFSLSDRVFLKS